MAEQGKVGAIVVIGGGIAGMQVAIDAAGSGFKVYLIESSPSIGGVMAQLDKTFPTNDCSTCIIAPKLIEVATHPNIEIVSYAEVLDVSGEPGNFTVKVKKKPRYVNTDKCVGCGVCATKCPKKVPHEFNEGLAKRRAIYVPFPQAVPLKFTIDRKECLYFKAVDAGKKGKCKACEKFCDTDAIDFDQTEEIIEIQGGAVIISPGIRPFDPARKVEYGYGRYANVLSSLEYERILSASGPTLGHIQRPSDGQEPKKMAWIQCVGSRDASIGHDYCSFVCCMYATKQAIITKEHAAEIQPTIFYMDMRAMGKGFDRYYEQAKAERGVRYVRSMVSRLTENPQNKNLEINYVDESGNIQTEEFDMFILSVGLCPHPSSQALAKKLDITLDQYGFCQSQPMDMVSTSRPGIFVTGAFQGPKDIPESVAQASSAAACAGALLSDVRGTLVEEKTYPEEFDVTGLEPRIGVYICHCGINIASVVDVEALAEYALTLPNVVFADHPLFACSADAQAKMKELIHEQKLNRFIIASCTPRTHEPLFRETCREAGLNQFLFEMANIRDQGSWVHMHEPELATEKAKELLRMAAAKVRLLKPLYKVPVDVVQKGLVVGGGLAGLTAAMGLADQGIETCLVERSDELGGHARKVHYTETGGSPAKVVNELIQEVEANPLITVYTKAEVIESAGQVGNFVSTLSVNGKEEKISHGAVIIATGGQEYKPTEEYLYGQDDRMLTQTELEQRVAAGDANLKTVKDVVMIQCVGSREEEHSYCSRVCCTAAIKNSLKLVEANPEMNINVLYRDIRTFGLKETYYKKARESGVRFFRYDPEQKPEVVKQGDRLMVNVYDQGLRTKIALNADLVVLSAAIRPSPEAQKMSPVYKVPLDQDGFFLEAHVKLRPIDFSNDGVFLCGLAHGPKFADESIAQAKGAVSRAMTVLSKKNLWSLGAISHVDENICRGCGKCEETCLFEAIAVEEVLPGISKAKVKDTVCKGCGACAVACPTGAAQLDHFTSEEILAMVEAAF